MSEKIEMSWDNLPPSAQTQQSHAQVMPHHFYPRNARIQNIWEISSWILHVVTLEAWKTNTNQNILHRLASIGIPTKPRARVTTWPVENHVISSKLWNLGNRYLNYKSQQFDNPNFRSKNKSRITEWYNNEIKFISTILYSLNVEICG